MKRCYPIVLLVISSISWSCHAPTPLAQRAPSVELPGNWVASQSSTVEIQKSLQSLFRDSTLNALVKEALAHNHDIRIAALRFEEAGFNTRKSKSHLFPRISATGASSRSKQGVSTNNPSSLSIDVSWEADVWGKFRAGTSAAQANQSALAADHEAARQSIAAQTMQAWFSFVTAELLLDLTQREYHSFKRTETLIRERFENGTGNLRDLDLAQTDTQLAAADIHSRKNNRNSAARQLEILLGRYPGNFLKTSHQLPSPLRTVAAGIPSDLLTRRPDVESAFQQVRITDHRVTQAHRDLFPSFTLTASGGSQSSSLSDLARSGFSVWSLGQRISAPIFEVGNRIQELKASSSRARIAHQVYQKTVLHALREVENALDAERYLAREETAVNKALHHAKKAELKAQEDYEGGLIEILSLLEARRRVFNTEQRSLNLRTARLNNRVTLGLALGKVI